MGAGARVRENGWARKKKAWEKKRSPCPFIKAVETVRLPTCPVKSLIPQAPRLMAGGITHTRIDENPVIRGHDLCFDKTCQGNLLAIRAVVGCEKRFE